MKSVFASALFVTTSCGASATNYESYVASNQKTLAIIKVNSSSENGCGCEITGCDSASECRLTWEGDGEGCYFRCLPKRTRLFE